jgi:hypothetical protein
VIAVRVGEAKSQELAVHLVQQIGCGIDALSPCAGDPAALRHFVS